jgi:hypothetical protein
MTNLRVNEYGRLYFREYFALMPERRQRLEISCYG